MYSLIIEQEYAKRSKSSAHTEDDQKRNKEIDDDVVVLIRLSSFAVILRIAVLALDMREHGRAKRAAPTHYFNCALIFSAVSLCPSNFSRSFATNAAGALLAKSLERSFSRRSM
jgi:hypothetical protein